MSDRFDGRGVVKWLLKSLEHMLEPSANNIVNRAFPLSSAITREEVEREA